MKVKKINLKDRTDWMAKFGVYAQNRDSRMFENESDTTCMTALIFDTDDENEVADELGDFLRDGNDYEYVLYDGERRLCGFVYYKDDGYEDDEPEEKKYVFRFHSHSWVDIEVSGTDAESAMEKAMDIYNDGDYEEQPENFENTDCEDITYYKYADNE